jgi:hypothetical protein
VNQSFFSFQPWGWLFMMTQCGLLFSCLFFVCSLFSSDGGDFPFYARCLVTSDYFFVYSPERQKGIVCWYEGSHFYVAQAVVAAATQSYITVSVPSRTMTVCLHIIEGSFFGNTVLGSLEQYPSQVIMYADPDSKTGRANQLLVAVLPMIIAQEHYSFSESSLHDFLAHFPMTIFRDTAVPLALLYLLDDAWVKAQMPPVVIRSAFSSVQSSANNSPVISSGSPASGATVFDDDELEDELLVGDKGYQGDDERGETMRPGAPDIEAWRNASPSS